MNKILTDQARKTFEIAQYYKDKGKPIEEALILALTHVDDKTFREQIVGFPYKKLDNYNILYIGSEIEKFIQKINKEIVTLKDIFDNIEGKNKILSKLKIKCKVKKLKGKEIEISSLDILSQFGYNLVDRAKEGLLDPVIGRTEEIQRVIHVLSRKVKNNPLLVGEPGTGKTAIIEAVAQKIAKEEAGHLNNKILFLLDLNSIVAGTKYRGDFENRMKEIINILIKNPNIILFVDEVHNLVGHSGQEYGNILKPYLSRGEIQVIGATTNKEYREIFQKEKALDRRFQSIMIDEPTKDETLHILKNISNIYENWHNVSLNNTILTEIVNLTDRYINYRKFPDKAIDVMDEVCSYYKSQVNKSKDIIEQEEYIDQIRLDMSKEDYSNQYRHYIQIKKEQDKLKKKIIEFNNKHNGKRTIVMEDLYNVFHLVTGIPIGNIRIKEKERLLNLESDLNSKIVGQKEAVKNISKALIRSKLGYTRRNKPIASFLLVGSSGTGKTLSSQVLANTIFPNQKSYQRFDMSEYIEPHSLSKLIGSPKGYVGFGSGGILTNFVKENPYSILLFDEIEKANGTIANLMLQLLDNGNVTDTNDETVNFCNTIVMYTTNCITKLKSNNNKLGFNIDNSKDSKEDLKNNHLYEELLKTFKPEFLNRIDYIVMFNDLEDKDFREIIDLEINKLTSEYLMPIDIKINKKVKDFIISKLKRKNARYISKTIQNEIVDPLIQKYLKNELNVNNKISVSISRDKVKFNG